MSEHKAIYDVTGLDCSIEEFKMRPCVRHRYSPEFVQPTPDEIKFVRTALLGWPQTKLGAFWAIPSIQKVARQSGAGSALLMQTIIALLNTTPGGASCWRRA